MGGQFSKGQGKADLPIFQRNSDLQYTTEAEMSSNLQSSDSTTETGTNPVLNTIVSGVRFRALSFGSLEEVTGSPFVINPEDVQCILDSKKVKWKNQKLFLLVKDYFDKSLLTLNSTKTTLDECLNKVRESQRTLQFALQQFVKEKDLVDEENKYFAILEAVKDFEAAGNPFKQTFIDDFLAIHKDQVLMLEKLEPRKEEFDEKLESVNSWRKVSIIIFASTFTATIICSLVAAAMAAPHVVAAGTAATSIPVGTIGTWINSLWKSYESVLKGQKELISSMYAGTCVAIKHLERIWVSLNSLSIEIQTLMQHADSTLTETETVKIVVEDIEMKVGVILKNIENLTEHADRCSQDIQRARVVVLQRAGKHPNN